jgi:hypothetical protein
VHELKWSVRVSLEIIVHNICDGLRVSRRAGSAAVDAVVNIGELVCYTVGLESL